MTARHAIIVMGVSGAGKSTLAAALAERLGTAFLEGDQFHPPENVAAMASGQPLNDAMRAPWLRALGAAAAAELAAGRGVVVSCSALKRAYREQLRAATGGCQFLFLEAGAEALTARMQQRVAHYMPASLLGSQFAALEVPGPEEADCHKLAAELPPGEVLEAALSLTRLWQQV